MLGGGGGIDVSFCFPLSACWPAPRDGLLLPLIMDDHGVEWCSCLFICESVDCG